MNNVKYCNKCNKFFNDINFVYCNKCGSTLDLIQTPEENQNDNVCCKCGQSKNLYRYKSFCCLCDDCAKPIKNLIDTYEYNCKNNFFEASKRSKSAILNSAMELYDSEIISKLEIALDEQTETYKSGKNNFLVCVIVVAVILAILATIYNTGSSYILFLLVFIGEIIAMTYIYQKSRTLNLNTSTCVNCGLEANAITEVCPKCGSKMDVYDGWKGLVGFFLPTPSLIYSLFKVKKYPKKCRGFLNGIIIKLALELFVLIVKCFI